MKKSTSGFTLVELLIVIIVIGILASLVIVGYNGAKARARDADRQSDVLAITKALELYYDDNGKYPDPSGTVSTISPEWYSSGDNSWTPFATSMAGHLPSFPSDPINSAGNPLTAGNYGYAYYTGNYCNAASGQWYILVYRYETAPKEKFTDGDCSTNPFGDTYYTAGNSYYRSVK